MAELKLRELNPTLGVEVSGLNPRIPIDESTGRALRNLFDERGLLVFRDLDIDLAFQTSLSGMLIGEKPQSGDVAGVTGGALIEYYVSNKEPGGGAPFGRLLYHSDMMWSENAFQALSLYGVEVEQPSVPTMFVSATHAWRTLPENLRARVSGRFAEHGHDATYKERAGGDADVLVSTFKTEETVRLPIGHRHPRTGQTILYVCQQMTHGIADMLPDDSEELLQALFDHLYASERVVEHHWRSGDLVIWDNLAVQHARPNVGSDGPTRTLRKVFAPAPQMNRTTTPQYRRARL
jgi:taurine dioxygenase